MLSNIWIHEKLFNLIIITNCFPFSSPLFFTPSRLLFTILGVDIHQQGTLVRVNVRKKKDTLYGKAVTSSSLQMESIAVERVNPDGDTRDRRTIEEIQQVLRRILLSYMPSNYSLS